MKRNTAARLWILFRLLAYPAISLAMVVIGYPINVMVHHDVGDYWQDGFVLVSFFFALSMGGFLSHFRLGYRLAFCLAIAAIMFLPMGLTLRDPATGALAPLYVLFPLYLCFVVVAYLGGCDKVRIP